MAVVKYNRFCYNAIYDHSFEQSIHMQYNVTFNNISADRKWFHMPAVPYTYIGTCTVPCWSFAMSV